MKKLAGKACVDCGEPVVSHHREPRGSYYYPKRCPKCSNPHPIGPANKRWTGARWPGPKGYILVTAGTPGQRRPLLEHRVVWEAAYGPIPQGAQIHHKNHDRADNRLENLELIASKSLHSFIHGGVKILGRWSREYDACKGCGTTDRDHAALGYCYSCYNRVRAGWIPGTIYQPIPHEAYAPRGETHHGVKLTPDQVREIRSLRGIMSQPALARQFGVSRGCISGIMYGVRWKHLLS